MKHVAAKNMKNKKALRFYAKPFIFWINAGMSGEKGNVVFTKKTSQLSNGSFFR